MPRCIVLSVLLLTASPTGNLVAEEGWLPLFDGASLAGWRVAGNPRSFRVEEGAIVAGGARGHLYHVGPDEDARFTNFEFTAEVMTEAGAESGVFFHTRFQERRRPGAGYEVQIDNSRPGPGERGGYRRTGSLYGIRDQYRSIVGDGEWFTVHLSVLGKRIRVRVNGVLLVDYTEPDEPLRLARYRQRRLTEGTFALKGRNSAGKTTFRNLRVRPLAAEEESSPQVAGATDATQRRLDRLYQQGFPLIDLHAHLKGGLTVEDLLAHARRTGINYGVAPNCGVGFPITDDAGIHEFIADMEGQPVFLGMQAEGREWVDLFSPAAVELFDYAFTDAMTFSDERGRRMRLWVAAEVHVDDAEQFMETLVDRTVTILAEEPIDVYANPTYLPAIIADRYDALWTEDRMRRVIDAAVAHGVAIEINAQLRLPKPPFIRMAKEAGARFTFGTNNGGAELGRLEYCLEMIDECGLTPADLFIPSAGGNR